MIARHQALWPGSKDTKKRHLIFTVLVYTKSQFHHRSMTEWLSSRDRETFERGTKLLCQCHSGFSSKANCHHRHSMATNVTAHDNARLWRERSSIKSRVWNQSKQTIRRLCRKGKYDIIGAEPHPVVHVRAFSCRSSECILDSSRRHKWQYNLAIKWYPSLCLELFERNGGEMISNRLTVVFEEGELEYEYIYIYIWFGDESVTYRAKS